MKNVYIFGAGQTGLKILKEIESEVNILGFLDNNPNKYGEILEGYEVKGDSKFLIDEKYDEIIIGSLPGYRVMNTQLIENGVPLHKINDKYVEMFVLAREHFLRDYSRIILKKYPNSSVAEGGVFQGEFARVINKYFPQSKLYLFDTFEGFDKRDVEIERENSLSTENEGHFATTSIELVKAKMIHSNNVVFKKGYFPETAEGIEEKFAFVNLDFDLYQPILEGLRYFYPRMEKGTIILIHDYFNNGYPGVCKAVEAFESEQGELYKFPIGDSYSIAILKI